MKVRELIDALIEQYAECGDAEVELIAPKNNFYTITYPTESHALAIRPVEQAELKTPTKIDLVIINGTEESPRAIKDIITELNAEMRKVLSPDIFEGFSKWPDVHQKASWPIRWKWIAVYPIRGGSEAHWVHVDLIAWKNGEIESTHQHMMMSKTFGGWEAACEIANLAGKLLDV